MEYVVIGLLVVILILVVVSITKGGNEANITERLGKLEVRMAEEGEKLTTLDNIERTLSSEDIVIADSTHGVGLAGVMGGLETEVEKDTKNIIIESAIFDSVKVRKTSKKIQKAGLKILRRTRIFCLLTLELETE